MDCNLNPNINMFYLLAFKSKKVGSLLLAMLREAVIAVLLKVSEIMFANPTVTKIIIEIVIIPPVTVLYSVSLSYRSI